MHFLVLGATGAIGTIFCEFSLEAGHNLTLFVRNREKVPAKISNNDRVAIIEGTLEDEEILDKVSKCGADVFVSFAGPPMGNQGTPLTDGYKLLIPKLLSRGTRRTLILCTPSFKGPSDISTFKWGLGEWTMKAFSSTRGRYREMIAVGEYITSLPVEDGVKWTLFRVGGLKNGEERAVQTTYLGSGKDAMWISRASIARWVLDESLKENCIGEMPYICN